MGGVIDNCHAPPPPASAEAVASSDSKTGVPFAFRGKESVATVVDTPRLHSPYSLSVISFPYWDHPPHPNPLPPMPVLMKTRWTWGW